ncbi:hypothetical protein JHK86_039665 [Glycine max]|nr:hypothetical protein JHK86_039665 [Glycine max]
MEMSARMDGADFGSFPTCKSNNVKGSRLWILIETNEIQHLPNNIYRLLLKAVKKHIVKEEKRRRFIEFVTSKFRNNQNLYDCVAIQQKIKLACDYTFLLNSVHHHKKTKRMWFLSSDQHH